MKIATFNINGIKARAEALVTWLREAEPDLVALQEIKSTDEAFPQEVLEAAFKESRAYYEEIAAWLVAELLDAAFDPAAEVAADLEEPVQLAGRYRGDGLVVDGLLVDGDEGFHGRSPGVEWE